MTTATMERQNLHQVIDTLSDDAVAEISRYVVSLREIPNARTRESMQELSEGRPFF
ncbi:MAG: hypothetical protein LBJ36_00185 [Synergistaceae bacterium]|jgi:cytochrome c553|nr:hypothetical protein [Synergistaceae bacterium]